MCEILKLFYYGNDSNLFSSAAQESCQKGWVGKVLRAGTGFGRVEEVMGLLSELNKEGTTIVMVTHSQHDAGFADRVINLFDGQVVTEVTI